ncbi:hypothetical protein MNBD_GAMMA10-1215, partial [hydrothermal vent metagenome]
MIVYIKQIICITVVFYLMACEAYRSSDTGITPGMLVSTDNMVLYADNEYSHKKKGFSSPAMVIEQSAEGYRLLQANGQIAWVRSIERFSQASITAERQPVDGTLHPRAFSEETDAHWMSVVGVQKGTLEAVSAERYESTPYYV